jgi:hypothetical protein
VKPETGLPFLTVSVPSKFCSTVGLLNVCHPLDRESMLERSSYENSLFVKNALIQRTSEPKGVFCFEIPQLLIETSFPHFHRSFKQFEDKYGKPTVRGFCDMDGESRLLIELKGTHLIFGHTSARGTSEMIVDCSTMSVHTNALVKFHYRKDR